MKKYCVCKELAKEMKELGFEQESEFYWTGKANYPNGHALESLNGKRTLVYQPKIIPHNSGCSAYTCGELGEMLPSDLNYNGNNYSLFYTNEYNSCKPHFWCIMYCGRNFEIPALNANFHEQSEANARAKMLIYLKKEGII